MDNGVHNPPLYRHSWEAGSSKSQEIPACSRVELGYMWVSMLLGQRESLQHCFCLQWYLYWCCPLISIFIGAVYWSISSFVLGSMARAGMWYSLFHFMFWTGSFYVAQAEFSLVVLMPPSPSPCIVDMHYHVCLTWDAITMRYPVSNTLVTR